MKEDKLENLKGAGVALTTPFTEDNSVDFTSLKKLVKHVIDGGIDFIVALGTTSEAVTLSKEERKAVVKCIIDETNNRVPIVMGLGGNNTAEVLNTINTTDFTGIDAILSVLPYYNKPQQDGIYYHFTEIAKASPVPIILYNVPGRTSSNILPETVIRLANKNANIIAIKEASGDLEQCMEIIKNTPKDFFLLSGDDKLTLPIVACGGAGVISVIANAYPGEFSKMVRLMKEGAINEAQQIHYQLLDIISAIFEDGNPAGIKAVLSIKGIMENRLRLPLVKVNDTVSHKISKLI
ncbi:MAG: 4-hydroxy-tetrahydrodipicolinate synthase [Hyphomicrobiales bacterium]